jgi:hypothetical protein
MRVLIRFIAATLGMFLCSGFASLFCFAQEVHVPRVSVGAVTKYTGPASSAQEQQSQEFLSNLELQLASGFAKSGDIDYLDRSNLYELFRELHISSWSFFDASTGSLHGLMGRLDFLIVAEASSATTARVKILDVETGAVKIATLCQPRTTMFGKASTDAPECVSQIVSQMATFAKIRFTTKRDRLIKAAVSQQEAEERRAKLAQEQKEEEQKRAQEEAAGARQRAAEERAAAEQRAAEQRAAEARQAEIDKQIGEIRPHYEEVQSQFEAQMAFWKQLGNDMKQQGRRLRPEIQALLSSSSTAARRCNDDLGAGRPDALKICLDELSRKLDQLEQYK